MLGMEQAYSNAGEDPAGTPIGKVIVGSPRLFWA